MPGQVNKRLTIRQEIKKNLVAKFENQLKNFRENNIHPGKKGRPYDWLTIFFKAIMADAMNDLCFEPGNFNPTGYDLADAKQLAIEIFDSLSLNPGEKDEVKKYFLKKHLHSEKKRFERPGLLKNLADLENQRGQEAVSRFDFSKGKFIYKAQGGRPSKKITWKESTKGLRLAQQIKNFVRIQPGSRATLRQIQRHFKNGSEFLSAKDLQDLQPCLTFHGVVRILPKEKWQPAVYAYMGKAFGEFR